MTLVRTPSELVLIDVGAGPHFMPNAGKPAENPDHLWAALDDDFDNKPMFPNASYVISAAEWNFWMADNVVSQLPG